MLDYEFGFVLMLVGMLADAGRLLMLERQCSHNVWATITQLTLVVLAITIYVVAKLV